MRIGASGVDVTAHMDMTPAADPELRDINTDNDREADEERTEHGTMHDCMI
jgi:hypothetical protein